MQHRKSCYISHATTKFNEICHNTRVIMPILKLASRATQNGSLVSNKFTEIIILTDTCFGRIMLLGAATGVDV